MAVKEIADGCDRCQPAGVRKRLQRLLLVRDIHALYVSAGYLCVALFWIWGSDFLVEVAAAGDVRLAGALQTAKGTAFVVVMSTGLYFAIAWVNARQRRLADEKRLVEEMLRVSARLEALGTLAGSLAHDFNNVLTVIRGVADMMKLEKFDPRTLPDHIAAIDQAAAHATEMTHEMMLFMRDASITRTAADIGAVVEDALPVLRRAVGGQIDLALCRQENLPLVRIARPQVERCLLNLVVNARDALRGVDDRRIELSISSRVLRSYSSLFQTVPVTGEFVIISVKDSGCGIQREDVARIFAPFFTTKPPGRGTGLGLTSVLKVLQMHDGWVEVESEAGRGACFSLYFPAAEKPGVASSQGQAS
jgi:signal transduction histidine kinase